MIIDDSFKNVITDFFRTNLGIDCSNGDDVDSYIITPLVAGYNKIIEMVNDNSIFELESRYRIMDFLTLVNLAKNVFFISEDLESLEETMSNREYIYSKITSQTSLDNLSKTGLKAYYEAKGYENVRVKYDIYEHILTVYGDLPDSYTTKTQSVTVSNGVIELKDLEDDEKIVSVTDITLYDSGGSSINMYSENSIIDNIKNMLAKENVSTQKINEFISSSLSNIISVEGKVITIKSPAVSAGVFGDVNASNNPDQPAYNAYMYLLKNGYSKDVEDIEELSSMAISVIKMVNSKIEEIDNKVSSVENKFGVLQNFASAKYTELMGDSTSGIKYNIEQLKAKIINANEKLGIYYDETDKSQKIINGLISSVQSLPSPKELSEFITAVNSLNKDLAELIGG